MVFLLENNVWAVDCCACVCIFGRLDFDILVLYTVCAVLCIIYTNMHYFDANMSVEISVSLARQPIKSLR